MGAGGQTQRHEPRLVSRSERNGPGHQRREEARSGTDRKASRISQGSEAERRRAEGAPGSRAGRC